MDGITITIDTITIGTMITTGARAPTLRWAVGPVQRQGAQTMPIEVRLTTEEQVRLAITPMTPGGQPAPVDGEAVWSVEGTCTLTPIDATSTWVLAGDVGDSTVTAMADADLGAGMVSIADTCLVHVENPMATNLGLSADAPVLKDG